jgi:hypothetical protein
MLHFKNLNHSVDQGRYPRRQVFSALVDRDFLVSVLNANVLSVNAEQDSRRASSKRFLLPADKILSPKLLGTIHGLIDLRLAQSTILLCKAVTIPTVARLQ